MTLVLASASPRRADLLRAAGYQFVVEPADVDERLLINETPGGYVARLARMKASLVAPRHPDAIVVAADTTVVIADIEGASRQSELLGKPADMEEALAMLRRLSGRSHDVMTGVALSSPAGLETFVETTRVWFDQLSDDDIQWYAQSGEPMDKAGGYAIQGLASRFVSRIEGSYSNVVGLPIAQVHDRLRRLSEGS